METILPVYKHRSETPLEAIQRIKIAYPEYAELPMTYAGRLDPMADGLLLLLAGETCKEKEKYTGLDKEYYVDIVWGISTDTYDVLGCVTEFGIPEKPDITALKSVLDTHITTSMQKYPRFSSKPINGTPMALLARDGKKITEEDIPTHEVTIYSADIIEDEKIQGNTLFTTVKADIEQVTGEFRQNESIQSWKDSVDMNYEYSITRISVSCSSGTYMRQLVHDIGERLSIPACAYRIYRRSIGDRWSLK